MRAWSERLGPDDPDTIYQPYLSAFAYGMGYGDDGGAGVQMSGRGDTERTAIAETTTPHAGGVGALGFAYADSSGSFGGLHDEGGNDRYTMETSSHSVNVQEADDTCGCPGVRAEAISNAILTAGMGATALGGVAMLRDVSGDDDYLATAESVAEARATDGRTALEANDSGATASAASGNVNVEVQGEGNAGTGILEDGGGDDSYDARATSRADADATAFLAGAVTESDAVSGTAQSFGQGAGIAGFGELRDDGGTDAYRTTNVSHAEAHPPTGVTQGVATSLVQGMMLGTGNALLLDGGGAGDTFASTPAARAPCSGTRGSEMWMDCGSGAAVGINR